MSEVVKRIQEAKARLKPMRVLVVDDDQTICNMLHRHLAADYRVEVAENGRNALAACTQKAPQLILLDTTLPDVNAFDLYRSLQNLTHVRYVPTIFMAYDGAPQTDRLEALELGVDNYITKPFDMDELRLIVRNNLPQPQTAVDPITGLPGWAAVESELLRLLPFATWTTLLVSIHQLEHFRETQGYSAGNQVLRTAANLLQDVVDEFGSTADPIAYLGEQYFVVVTGTADATELVATLRQRFSRKLQKLLPDVGLLPGLLCGMVNGRSRRFADILEVIQTAESLQN